MSERERCKMCLTTHDLFEKIIEEVATWDEEEKLRLRRDLNRSARDFLRARGEENPPGRPENFVN